MYASKLSLPPIAACSLKFISSRIILLFPELIEPTTSASDAAILNTSFIISSFTFILNASIPLGSKKSIPVIDEPPPCGMVHPFL